MPSLRRTDAVGALRSDTGLDGWAIAELVRTLGPDSPRIIFSTGAPQDIPEDIAALGCVLEKPYDAAILVDLLREPEKRGLISRLRDVLR